MKCMSVMLHILQLIIVTAIVAGCTTPTVSQPTASPTLPSSINTATRTTLPTAATASSNAAVAPTAPPNATRTAAEGPIVFPDAAGLNRQDRYTLVLRVTFKGTRDGQPVDSTDTITRTFSRDPAAQFTTIETTGPDNKSLKLLYGSIGQVQYARMGDNRPCTAQLSLDPNGQDPFIPAQMLMPARRGSLVGNEMTNGVPTRHYALDASSFDRNAAKGITGDVWIREAGDLVVKYIVRTSGDEAYLGRGIQGERTTSFEVTDIGVRKDVVAPPGCPPAFSDLPAMADATNLVRTPSGLSYLTASALDKTIAFYQEKMKALGWVLESSSGAVSAHNFLIYALPKEKKYAYVTLTVAGSNVQVDVQVEQN